MIVYIGNMLSVSSGSVSVIENLAPRLSKHMEIKAYSNKVSRVTRLLEMWLSIIRNKNKARYVLIDAYSSPMAFFYLWSCSQLCRFINIPYIPILHGGNFPERLNQNPILCEMIFLHSHLNISPSSYLKAALVEKSYRCRVIPNAIELGDYSYKYRTCAKPRLLWVRSFDQATYNPLLAIEVLYLMLNLYPDTQLCMVGSDKDGSMETCRNKAASLGIADHLTIMGKMSREEWTSMAKDFDIFINTTNIDNTPLSLIEAMALGLPVVSTDVGGITYMIRNEENGMLLPPKDPDAFIKAIESLIKSEELVSKLSANGRKTALQWSWERVMPQWLDLLNDKK